MLGVYAEEYSSIGAHMPCKQFTELEGVKIEVCEGGALVADLAAVGLTPWRDAFSLPNIDFRQQDDLGVEVR